MGTFNTKCKVSFYPWARISVLSMVALNLLLGCELSSQSAGSYTKGLLSPIVLSDTTHIYWADYFWEPQSVQILELPQGIEHLQLNELESILMAKMKEPMGLLTVETGGKTVDLVLKNSEQEEILFRYPDPNKEFALVQIKGEMNGWNTNAHPMNYSNGYWQTTIPMEAGVYAYKFVVDGEELIDPNNSVTTPNGFGSLNSVIEVGEREEYPPVLIPTEQNGQSITVRLESYLPKTDVVYQTQNYSILALWENSELEVRNTGYYWEIDIPEQAAELSRSHIRLWLSSPTEALHELKLPLQQNQIISSTDQLNRNDRAAWNMYFVFLDRFKDGNPENNRKVDDPDIHPSVNYYGGDLQGLSQKIASGYFDSLSINTLWLSPIVQNPETAYGLWDEGGVMSKFSGYHGYWPISSSRIDDRMGTREDLEQLIEMAHAHDMNILLDYVANHVHEEHPVMEQHPDWKTDLYLPDGRMNTQLWDEERLTTWFDTFMPSLDFSKPEVVEAMSDSALYWVREFDIDGFRHDATKHIPLEFWRTLTKKILEETQNDPGRSFYQIGETYGSRPLISSYVRSGLLDAQFDFSLFDAAQASFGQGESFTSLAQQLQESLRYYGMNNEMGVISGNHDKARFITLASGEVRWDEDAKLAAWTREIPDPSEEGYQRLKMMHTWMFTVPGIPVTYYGDEFGLPGANDPDNRRWMKFDDYTSLEAQTLDHYTRLSKLRANHLALQYGALRFQHISEELLIHERTYFNESIWVFFNSSEKPISVEWEHPFTGDLEQMTIPALGSELKIYEL